MDLFTTVGIIQNIWEAKAHKQIFYTPAFQRRMLNSTKPLVGISSILAILLVVSIAPNFDSSIVAQSEISDVSKFGGYFEVTHENWKGEILSQQTMDNLVPNEGLECISDLIFGTTECVSESFFNYVGIGTGLIPPVDSDLALGAESGTCARIQDATVDMNTGTTGQRLSTFQVVFTGATCTGQVFAEVGIFDASSSGNMVATALLPNTVQLFNASDTLTVTYNINNVN